MQTILRIRFGLCSSELYGEWGTDVWFVYALFGRSSWAVYRFGYLCRIGNDIDSVFTGKAGDLTTSVIVGVVVTLVGIGIIGLAGSMKSASLSEEEERRPIKDFNFTKGIIVALLAGIYECVFQYRIGFWRETLFC